MPSHPNRDIANTRQLRHANKRLLKTQTAITRFLQQHELAVGLGVRHDLSPHQSAYFRRSFHTLIDSILSIFVDADEIFGNCMSTWWCGDVGMELLMQLFQARLLVQRLIFLAGTEPEMRVLEVAGELECLRDGLLGIRGLLEEGFAEVWRERRLVYGHEEEERWMDGLEGEMERLEREMRVMEEGGAQMDEEDCAAESDGSVTEESVTEECATEEPATEESSTEQSVTEESVTEESVTEESATEKTVGQEQTTAIAAATESYDVADGQDRRESNYSGYAADDETTPTTPFHRQHFPGSTQ